MKSEKILRLVSLYRQKLIERGVKNVPYHDKVTLISLNHSLEYCYGMLDRVEEVINEEKITEAHHCLGFIQGIFWANMVYTFADFEKHNTE
ncbi:MAG TPA: hypothetical protein VMR73_00615 [Candidatus Paceibacterota bacterium]|nr:hypothetical protein [Candidatus Paceibacterota bacterium]